MSGPPAATMNVGSRGAGTTSGQTSANTVLNSAGLPASLSNNPTDAVYRPDAALTPDEQRQTEVLQEVEITAQYRTSDGMPILGGTTVTAPHWSFAEEAEYWRLRAPMYSYRPDGYFGGGMQDASEDEVTYLAQRNVAHDIRRSYRNFGDMQARADDLRLMRLFTPMNQLALGEGIISTVTGAAGMVANGWASMAFRDTGFGTYVQEQMTYSPRLQISQDAFSALAPLAEGLEYARSTFGDAGYSATGSPAIGAALTTLPDALAFALVPEARAATANVARGVGNGASQGGKWLANGAGEMLYQAGEAYMSRAGLQLNVVPASRALSISDFSAQLDLPVGAQRALLRQALDAQGTGMVSHHLVPVEAQATYPDLIRRAAEGGFNFNGVNNGALLKGVEHWGGHPRYNAVVLQELGRISPNLTPTQTAVAIQRRADILRDAIRTGTFGPWE